MDANDHRFDRIEAKIDKLTDAVTKIVKVEEQIASNNRRVDSLETRVDQNTKDIHAVAEVARGNSAVTKVIDKVFWLVITGLVSYLFYTLR